MAIDPVSPIPTLQPNAGSASPAQLEAVRRLAAQLMQRNKSPTPVYTWANGLDDAAGSVLGALQYRRADELERAQAAAGAGALSIPGEDNSSRGVTNGGAGVTGSAASPSGTRATSDNSIPSGSLSDAALRLSTLGETGQPSWNAKALSNISPDANNSRSYGPFGLNSWKGSAGEFAKSYPHLGLTADPGTTEFDSQWRNAVANNPDAMIAAHRDWHAKNILGNLPNELTAAGVDPKLVSDPKVQLYMADRKLQQSNVGLKQALAAAKDARTPDEFLQAVSAADKANVGTNFRTYLSGRPNDVQGLYNRIDLRRRAALGYQPATADGSSLPSAGVAPAVAPGLAPSGAAPAGGLPLMPYAPPQAATGPDLDFTGRMIAYQRQRNPLANVPAGPGATPLRFAQAAPAEGPWSSVVPGPGASPSTFSPPAVPTPADVEQAQIGRVREIQQRLGIQQTGVLDPTTQEAVTAFRQANGIPGVAMNSVQILREINAGRGGAGPNVPVAQAQVPAAAPGQPPVDQVTGVPPGSQTFTGAPGRPGILFAPPPARSAPAAPAATPQVPQAGSQPPIAPQQGAAPQQPQPAPPAPAPATASPQGTPEATPRPAQPAGTQALPDFLPPLPKQQLPELPSPYTIRSLYASLRPGDQQEAIRLLEIRRQALTPQPREFAGRLYLGSPYTGWHSQGPAKADEVDIPTEYAGVGTFHNRMQRVYDPQGNLIGYKPVPMLGQNQEHPAQTAANDVSGSSAGTPQMRAFINKTVPVAPQFPNSTNPNDLIRFGSNISEYRRSGKEFQDQADRIAAEAHASKDDETQLRLLERVLQHPDMHTGWASTTMEKLSDVVRQMGLGEGELATWRQVAEKLGSRQQVADVRNTTIGQGTAVRQAEADAIRNSQLNLERTPGANLAVVRLQLHALDRLQELGDLADLYIQRHGRLDNGFNTVRNQWFHDHPFMTTTELDNYNKITGPGEKKEGSIHPTTPSPQPEQPVQSAQPAQPGSPPMRSKVKEDPLGIR